MRPPHDRHFDAGARFGRQMCLLYAAPLLATRSVARTYNLGNGELVA